MVLSPRCTNIPTWEWPRSVATPRHRFTKRVTFCGFITNRVLTFLKHVSEFYLHLDSVTGGHIARYTIKFVSMRSGCTAVQSTTKEKSGLYEWTINNDNGKTSSVSPSITDYDYIDYPPLMLRFGIRSQLLEEDSFPPLRLRQSVSVWGHYCCPSFLIHSTVHWIAAGKVSEWSLASGSGSEKDENSWCGRGQIFFLLQRRWGLWLGFCHHPDFWACQDVGGSVPGAPTLFIRSRSQISF